MSARTNIIQKWAVLILLAAPGCYTIPATSSSTKSQHAVSATASRDLSKKDAATASVKPASYQQASPAQGTAVPQLAIAPSQTTTRQEDTSTAKSDVAPPPGPESLQAGSQGDVLTLEEVIGVTIASNPDLYSASQQIAIADATLCEHVPTSTRNWPSVKTTV